MSTELEIRVTAELREIKAALAGLSADIGRVGQRANASAAGGRQLAGSLQQSALAGRNAAREAGGLQGAIAGAVTQAKLLFAGLGALGLVTSLVKAADTTTRLNGQIRLVTKSQDEFNRAQRETFAIAQRTRQGLEATVGLYGRIARAGRTTQTQTLELTESINQAVALSFTTAQAGEAALFQLGQGLGSGTLRGEELNSVLEQTPRLAAAIAEGLVKLGKIKDPGDLREFAKKNGIAASLVVEAIATQQEKLRAEFAKLEPTVADAMTAVKNSYLQFIGDTNSASGASRSLADAILLLANNFGVLAGAIIAAVKITAAYYLAFRVLPAIVTALGAAFVFTRNAVALATPAMTAATAQAIAIQRAFAGATVSVNLFSGSLTLAALRGAKAATLLKAAFGLLFAAFAGWQIGTYLREEFKQVELFGIAMAAGLHKVAFTIGHSFRTTGVVVREVFREAFNYVKRQGADLLENMAGTFAKLPDITGGRLAKSAAEAAKLMRASITDTDGAAGAYARLAAEGAAGLARIELGYADLAAASMLAKGATDKVTDPTKPPTTGVEKAVGGMVDKLELLKDAAQRALLKLEQLYEDGGISTRAFFAEKVRLQQMAIDADMAAARGEAAAATTSEQRSKALTQLVILERERRDVALAGTRDQAKAEDDLVDQLGQVKAKLLDLGGDTARARSIELEAQYRDLLVRLERNADETGMKLVRKLINVEAAKAQLDEYKAQAEKALTELSASEQSLAQQAQAGMIGGLEAEKQIDTARTQALDKLRQLRAAVGDYYAATKDPAVLEYLNQLDGSIGQVVASQQVLQNQVKDLATSALTTFFSDMATGAKSAKEAFADLAKSFVDGLTQIAAKALATFIVMKVLDSVMPGFASMFAAMNGGKFHRGGVVGTGGTAVGNLNPMAFAMAPRYHSGGFAGLASNEVAAVLERGEEVITANDPRHARNGGGKAGKGGGDVYVTVENNTSGTARTEESTAPDGGRMIKIIVDAAVGEVTKQIGQNGGVGKAIGSRFGLNPVGATRG